MSSSVEAAKHRIRASVRASRAARTLADREVASTALTQRLEAVCHQFSAITIACYLPVRGEPDTTAFMRSRIEAGDTVLVPAMRADGLLDWVRLECVDTAINIGDFGILEPQGERLPPSTLEQVDVVFAPACAVDERGTRLGWGRGFYDRTLASLTQRPPVFAVVYDDEVFTELPREPHDISMTGIVTPQGVR